MDMLSYWRMKNLTAFIIVIYFGAFMVKASTDIAECGTTFNMTEFSLRIVSPGNYTSYPRNLDCDWLLTGPSTDDTVLYRFEDVRVDCGDGISAYDGMDRSANAQNKDLCTTGGPIQTPLQTTSGSNLLVTFKTDNISKESDRGFFTRAITGRDLSQCPVTNSTINLTATANNQVLTSPNFPRRYSTNYVCEWNIESEDPLGTIRLTFAFIDIDKDPNSDRCFDSVTMFEGQTKIKEICGSEIFTPGSDTDVTSSGNQIRVVFTSDDIQTEYGFKLLYRQIASSTSTPTSPTTLPATTTPKIRLTTPRVIPSDPSIRRITTQPTTVKPSRVHYKCCLERFKSRNRFWWYKFDHECTIEYTTIPEHQLRNVFCSNPNRYFYVSKKKVVWVKICKWCFTVII